MANSINTINVGGVDKEIEDTTARNSISSEVSRLDSRIDNIIAPAGGAPSAEEVQDARIGADNVIYPNLGTAIRTQIGNIKSAIDNAEAAFNDSTILFNRLVKDTGTAANIWVADAISAAFSDFTVMLTETKNVAADISNIVRIRFVYSDSTESNFYVKTMGVPYRCTATSGKTISNIDLSFYRASSAVGESVTSEWGFIAYTNNKVAENSEAINELNTNTTLLNVLNDLTILINRVYENEEGVSTWWVSNPMPARQDPFYIMVTATKGVDASAPHIMRILYNYSDNTSDNRYVDSLNTPVLVSPTSGKTVTAIIFGFYRASSTVSFRWTSWDVIAWAGDKIGKIGKDLDTLEANSEIVSRSVDKYEKIFQELDHIMITDDGTSTWASNISLGHNVMRTDDRGIIIEINPLYIIGRVYIWKNAPEADVRYDKLYNWNAGSWYRAYVPPFTYFAVIFRNPTQTTGLTVDTIQNNCRIMYYDEYVQAYKENGIQAFDEKVVEDMEDYPIMFGVITDAHYPTGDDYESALRRNYIKHGCETLKKIASRLNAFFIANLGDDAGYSDADTNEGNIIQSMTMVDGMLRGGVRVLPVNGNHEAFQNHEYMDSTDFYRARLVNLEGVTKVSNVATNYYFDDDFFKIRFVFFDDETYHRNDYSDEIAGSDLQSMFSTAPNDYKFILFCHKDIGGDADFPQSTSFYTSIASYIPRLLFQCSGHTHKDGYYYNNGVRNINFIAAACFNYIGLTEVGQWGISDRESSFAIVGVNPTTMKVKIYGYGMASDREFDFSS